MPLRKLTLTRKSSSNKIREDPSPSPREAREATPTKTRPPESASASTRTPESKGSVRGKKAPPSSFNQAAEEGDAQSPSTRPRKMSLASKGKRRLSSMFSSSPSSNSIAAMAASPEPEGIPVALKPVNGTDVSGTSTPTAVPGDTLEKHPESTDSTERALPSLPADERPEVITAGLASLHIPNGEGTPSRSKGMFVESPVSGFNGLDSPSQPRSNVSTPSRQARVNSLYTQWADDSDSDDDDDGFATPSEGLSEVEEEDEDEDAAKPIKAIPSKPTNTFNGSATPSIAPSATTTLNGPRVTRSHAGAAKVSQQTFKRGDPMAIDQAAALAPDLELCRQVLSAFLSSRMREAEEMLIKNDPDNNHMYLQSGHGLIESLKGMMTFDSVDLLAALEITKGTAATATTLRRPGDSLLGKIGGLVRAGHGVQRVRQMSALERHAELVYAETVLIKAILAIVSGGDWLGLIKEALNMRTAHGIYRTLQQFLEEADKNGFDEDIDMDFRSGVLLGTGTSSLMLSLLPARVLKIAEVFGYAGDRTIALSTLMSAGGWTAGSPTPAYTEENEGIRRPICDMILLTFHLVISVLMPVSGVDIETARNILNYNMKKYPNGIFFLYFQARLHTSECEPELANESLQRALDLDLEYVQLQHMCLWDYGCNYLQLTNWEGARQCYDILRQESNWSRATYTYATAATTMEIMNDTRYTEATPEAVIELVSEIPKLTKKIAGKSLPIEKFVARKSRKFLSQGNRLFLPAMEVAYVFGTMGSTPRRILVGKWLPYINASLARLEASTPETWGNGQEYWDDYALGHFLRGVAQAVARHQPAVASARARERQPGEPSDEELDAGAEADFKRVVEAAPNVRLDHYILFHNHYELGRLYAKRGDAANARANFEVVMNNKLPQPNMHAGKNGGKYSLEGALQIKTHAAMSDLKENGSQSVSTHGKNKKK